MYADFELARIFGLFMILTAVLALVADLAVSGLVRSIDLPGQCAFTQGFALNATTAEYPSMQGIPYLYASNAQITSFWGNDGLIGVYRKADNSTNFSAQADDVLGYWDCGEGSSPVTYYGDQTNDGIVDRLEQADLIFSKHAVKIDSVGEKGGQTRQLLVVSTDTWGILESTPTPFSFKIAVDIKDDLVLGEKTMVAYHCQLVVTGDENLLNVLAQIDIDETLETQGWVPGMQGQLYQGFDMLEAAPGIRVTLGWILNSLTMVAASENSIQYTSDENARLSCWVTRVPWPVTLIWGVTTVLGFFFIFCLTYLFFLVRRASKIYDRSNFTFLADTALAANRSVVNSKEITHNTPNGLIDWMQHAIHETGTAEKHNSARHLRKWLFSTSSHRGSRMSVVSKNFSPVPHTPYNDSSSHFGMIQQEQSANLFTSPAASSESRGGYFSPPLAYEQTLGIHRKPVSTTPSPPGTNPQSGYFSPPVYQGMFGVQRKPVHQQYSALPIQEG